MNKIFDIVNRKRLLKKSKYVNRMVYANYLTVLLKTANEIEQRRKDNQWKPANIILMDLTEDPYSKLE